MFNLSSYWSRKIPERGGCVSFLPNFSNEPTLLHAEFYSNKLVANLRVACDNYFYGGFIKKKFSRIEKVMIAFSIPEKMFLKIESLMYALRAHVNQSHLYIGC